MIKYELYHSYIEIPNPEKHNYSEKDIVSCYDALFGKHAEFLASFDDKDKALEEYNKTDPLTVKYNGSNYYYLECKLIILQECLYDDNGEDLIQVMYEWIKAEPMKESK